MSDAPDPFTPVRSRRVPGQIKAARDPLGRLGAFGLVGAGRRPRVRAGILEIVPVETSIGWHLRQLGRAGSRLLNVLRGGEGDTTYSAGSWARAIAPWPEPATRWEAVRSWPATLSRALAPHEVRMVDWLNREPGHCYAAWEWHRERGLLADDGPG